MRFDLRNGSFLFVVLALGACSVPTADNAEGAATSRAAVTADGRIVSSRLLWHNGATGDSQLWSMADTSRASFTNLDNSLNVTDSTGWRVVATVDFNADGQTDILWHNGSSGATQVWYMNPGGATRFAYADFDVALTVTDDTGWRVVGASDFNADGHPDILWHNVWSGASQVWYLNGVARQGFANLDAALNVPASTGWSPVALTDFDFDGYPDILWHNGLTGESQSWGMQGVVRISFPTFDASLNVTDDTGWRVAGVWDFNLDGFPDILWHNGTSGVTQVWYMQGINRIGYADFDSSLNVTDSTGWRLVGVR